MLTLNDIQTLQSLSDEAHSMIKTYVQDHINTCTYTQLEDLTELNRKQIYRVLNGQIGEFKTRTLINACTKILKKNT